ncbi:hypothetical protein LBYS11_12140 [Lysinibacillus sp. YS11]|uniref:hypothetical protein n=1 Tax=unclassified Lysinibacillus TaxID=2636778 RepID=UPI000826741A|nr:MULTISPECIES: hypothetical protein [unclassified Lysinibacillus]AUS87034.1 hypothetical protein LBYS11_12140 [Lysinibacillus sp. YS11]OCX62725.1 hypothetical protein BFM98_01645 [Lysinibacillus sp. AR18-8]
MCSVRIRGTNRIPQLIQSLSELAGYEIEVGIFGSDDSFYAMIAAVHEFGITIRKERGAIVIPERSFLRSTFDEKNGEWAKFVKKQLPKLLDGQMNARTICERLGAKMVGDIQRKLTQLDDPPNAPSTIAQKGSSNPLIDKGGLRMRITYKVVSR